MKAVIQRNINSILGVMGIILFITNLVIMTYYGGNILVRLDALEYTTNCHGEELFQIKNKGL